MIEGSNFVGPAPGDLVPTSYWRMAGLKVAPWISAEAGDLLPVTVSETKAKGPIPAGSRAWLATDGAGYDVELWYDSEGEWTGCAFDASGEPAHYALLPGSVPVGSLM